MNHAVLQGLVASSPRLYTGERTPCCTFDLEVEALKEGDPPFRLPTVLWGGQAEWLAGLGVGQAVIATGRIEVRSGGEGKPKTSELHTSRIELIGPAPSDEEVPF